MSFPEIKYGKITYHLGPLEPDFGVFNLGVMTWPTTHEERMAWEREKNRRLSEWLERMPLVIGSHIP